MDKTAQQLAQKANEGLRRVFVKNSTYDYSSRIRVLKALRQSFVSREDEIMAALYKDLRRNRFDAMIGDYQEMVNTIDENIKHLSEWMKDEPREAPMFVAPGSVYMKNDPLGVALVVGAWNFPFSTTMIPVVSAIAAGNCVCIKPSEMSAESSRMMYEITQDMKEESVICMEGAAETIIALLEQRWDVIVFTGSPEKGKLIAQAAAKHLTPTVLELGGKNPVIIDKDADMDLARTRIFQGRFINTGQLCISPEFALVHSSRLNEFLEACKRTSEEFFGTDPKQSPDVGRIVNDMHFQRIARLLEGHGGEVIIGGQLDASERYIAPTVLLNPDLEAPVCKEEIFGPILIVRTFDAVEEAKDFINEREKPLALYYFGKTRKGFRYFVDNTSSGGAVWNDTIMQHACSSIGFGGVGNSGMSKIAGREGFNALTHRKGVLEAATFNGYPVSARFPPHTASNEKLFSFLLKKLNFPVSSVVGFAKKALFVGTVAVAAQYGYLDPVILPMKSFAATFMQRN